MNNRLKLSIIIPVYNEDRTILSVVHSLQEVDFGEHEVEIIMINDGSTDDTKKVLDAINDERITIIHKENGGKGSATRAGLQRATGDIVVIQDGDIEYNVHDIPKLIEPFEESNAQAVYGSRFLGTIHHMPLPNKIANKLLTFMNNLFWGRGTTTDSCTCYKMLDRELIQSFDLQDEGFDICHEITANLRRKKINIVEIPISYTARSGEEGKKAKWWNLLKSIWAVFYYRFLDPFNKKK